MSAYRLRFYPRITSSQKLNFRPDGGTRIVSGELINGVFNLLDVSVIEHSDPRCLLKLTQRKLLSLPVYQLM